MFESNVRFNAWARSGRKNAAASIAGESPVDHEHFRAPVVLPVLGAIKCAFLAGPWARNEAQREQYEITGYLLVVGAVLWLITWLINRAPEAATSTAKL